MVAGLKTVVLLAILLALGFLLVILSCALWSNWLPLLSAFTFVLAPLPNALCARCAGADLVSDDYNSAYTDFGHWLTGALLLTGLSLPLIWSHAQLITTAAAGMAIAGGLVVYATVVGYGMVFGGGAGDDY